MSRSRRAVANVVLLAILLGSAAAIVSGRELWPFSPYPMFSAARSGPTVTRLRLHGLLPGGGEVRLTDAAAFRPFRPAQLETGLGRLAGDDLRKGLADVLSRYGARRRAGAHDGPKLLGLRLYRMTFAREAQPVGGAPPLSVELVAEVLGEG